MVMQRAFSHAAMAVAFGLVGFSGAPAVAAETAHPPHWAYEGKGGPVDWGALSEDYHACAAGKEQSPVDIRDAIPAKLPAIAPTYQAQAAVVVNNGHTLQVNVSPGSTLDFRGQHYELLQYHFHHPSEHLVNGKAAPLELHLVHKGPTALTVIGVMLVPGAANPAIEAIWKAAPTKEGGEATLGNPGPDLGKLLPESKSYTFYEGSLTTPPCSEVVNWINLKTPVTVSEDQIARFAALFSMNARPAQALHRRIILDSDDQ
ncbi:carbonate dehydratase [Rhodospirillum rubrum]|uniref:carbonic anhydrase n=1 Tax=Rhodospirillum rubrum TaxID=1085 RepID=UPI001902FFB7|nr:carbonic anhydrase family protein [Rhodospirillum rubrum]MBK1665471.1 carbonate dehydratase [Rhodospirillum rubrum]MBK1677413.1 carbonate dehydratase [Rhodospirillum rubrum]